MLRFGYIYIYILELHLTPYGVNPSRQKLSEEKTLARPKNTEAVQNSCGADPSCSEQLLSRLQNHRTWKPLQSCLDAWIGEGS